jgi:hypothetical protein
MFPPPGAPPLPRGGPPTGSITSDHTGDSNDDLRTMIMAGQKWLESNRDDQDAHAVMKCVVALQGVLAGHAKDREAALGTTPALRHVRRASGGNY